MAAKTKKPLIGWGNFTVVSIVSAIGALNWLLFANNYDLIQRLAGDSAGVFYTIIGLCGFWMLVETVNMLRK